MFFSSNNAMSSQRLAIDIGAVTQLFAWFEVRNVLAVQLNFVTGFRVATYTRGTVVKRKTAESADLNAFALGQRSGHVLKHLFHCILNGLRRNMRLLASKSFNKFRLGHSTSKLCS
ncbi:hypothetical protein BMF92_14840 [Serratia sp. OLBL1]|nr:hypothetical protein AN479_01610 [Serratia marcescens]ODJ15448.1 hypothetical protein BBC05_14490 [Serratia sp. ISTD04]OKP53236.1 hypothetical protein A8A12_07780 [Serratia marcescens]PII60310.1 hypothetical protein BMF92_14840 [Serratia sp. OLBL1]